MKVSNIDLENYLIKSCGDDDIEGKNLDRLFKDGSASRVRLYIAQELDITPDELDIELSMMNLTERKDLYERLKNRGY